MDNTKRVSFANFVCRFGDKHVMLDLAEDVVVPAFLDGGQRKYGDSRYIIQEASIANFGTSSDVHLVLMGRLIKDTTLKRDQVLVNGKLVKSKASIESAPSAVFVLILDTHKLLYLPETAYAPSLSAFAATVRHLVKEKHKHYLNGRYEVAGGRGGVETRRSLLERFPYPTVEVVPLSSTDDFEHFLRQFKTLQQVRIELIDTNNEVDGMELIKTVRNIKDGIKADGASVTYRRSGGLKIREAIERFTGLAEDGNTKMSFAGKDKEGDKLAGNNEQFKLAIPFDVESTDPKVIGRKLFDVFREKIKAKLLKIQPVEQSARNKVISLARKLIR